MSVREGMRTVLTTPGTLRASLVGTVVVGLALVATWPHGTLAAAMRSGQATDTFSAVSICFLLVLLYLEARFGAEDFAADPAVGLREYIRLTPVSPVSLAAGRLAVGILHTFVLLLLGMPLLVASMAVGGAGFAQVIAALLLAGAAGLAARMWGLLALVLLGDRRPLRDMAVFVVVAASAVLTFIFTPTMSPFRLLEDLTRPPPGGSWAACAAASGAAALVLAAASSAAMAVARARTRKRTA